jgi:hypothetical protein
MKKTKQSIMLVLLVAGMALLTRPALAAPPYSPKGFNKQMGPSFQLMRLAHNIGKIDGAKGKLTAAQAKSILGIINPLKKKISLSGEEAQKTTDKINSVLTAEQKKIISAMKSEKHLGGGPGGPDGMHPDGQGGPGKMPPGERRNGRPGERREDGPGGNHGFGGGMMSNFNPFNPPTDVPMADKLKKQNDELFAKLEKIAGAKTKSKKTK